MKNKHLVLAFLLTALTAALPVFAAEKCPAVNCNCSAFSDEGWRLACEAEELRLVEGCIENKGEPAAFCRIHGPLASPVALSISKSIENVQFNLEHSLDFLKESAETKSWSINEDLRTLKVRIKALQFGQALQIAKFLDENSEELFEHQRQYLYGLEEKNKRGAMRKQGVTYAEERLGYGERLMSFADSLRVQYETSNNSREKKAYKILSERLARLAGQSLEQSAYIYSMVDEYQDSAAVWQQSADTAEKLLSWELNSSNNDRVASFYRDQAAGRWARATFYWLKDSKFEQAVATNQRSERATKIEEPQSVVDLELDVGEYQSTVGSDK